MIGRLVDRLTALTRLAAAGFMAVMAAVLAAEVFCRYALNSSLYFAEELSRFCFVWAGFLGASLAFREGGHIAVTLLTDRLGPAARARALALARALTLVLLAVITGAGISILPDQWAQATATLGFSVFWFYLAVPVGSALMGLQVLALLCSSRSR